MAKMNKWLWLLLCVGGWASLYGLFLHLESDMEPTMFANGQQGHWWTIVLSYWIADTAIVLTFARKTFWSSHAAGISILSIWQ